MDSVSQIGTYHFVTLETKVNRMIKRFAQNALKQTPLSILECHWLPKLPFWRPSRNVESECLSYFTLKIPHASHEEDQNSEVGYFTCSLTE